MSRRILAIPGPTILDVDVLKALLVSDVGHMSMEFTDIVADSLNMLRKIVYADSEYQPIILSGSGTVAMEASLTNFIRKGDKALILSNGYFGELAYKILSRYPIQVDIIRANEIGTRVDNKFVIEKLEENNYSIVAATHVDTSTGVAHNIKELGAYIRDTETIFIVDGVCSVAGEELHIVDDGVDVLFTGSQKALSTPVGLSIVWLSPKAIHRLDQGNISPHYMDLSEWIKVMKGYEEGKPLYYATPAVNLVYGLNSALKNILDYGLEMWFEKHRVMAGGFREGVKALGLEILAKNYCAASTVSAVYLPDGVSWSDFRREMFRRNVIVAGGLISSIKDKYFRVGHMGMMNYNDIIAILGAIERSLSKLGYPIDFGASLAKFQEYVYKYES